MGLQSLPTYLLVCFLFFALSTQRHICEDGEGCPFDEPPPFCGIPGQTDLYGFGVRFGVYGVWAASWITNNYVIEEYDGALDSNSIFLLAIGIAVALNSAYARIRLIDGLILVQLGFGFISTVMTVWGYRTAVYHQEGAQGALRFGGLGTHIRLWLLSGITGFNAYFWSDGIFSGFPLCNLREECNGIRVFFFGSQSLFSGARKFYLAIAALCCIHYLCLIFSCLAWLAVALGQWLHSENPNWSLQRQRVHYECLTIRE